MLGPVIMVGGARKNGGNGTSNRQRRPNNKDNGPETKTVEGGGRVEVMGMANSTNDNCCC